MANRTIELTLKAQVGQMVAGLNTARDAVNATGRDVAGFVRTNERDMQTFGTALTAAGAGLTAMTVGAVKAAIDWESAWAGVQKTNDGTSEQMTLLEEDLRNLAKTLPATHGEIAAVAEAAGQLGVGVDHVAEFSETMINLGETTNLSADEAATALARFSAITGTSFGDVDRLGSALVGLGNNFATTESEILEMSSRLAAAGSQAGLSEGEIMGLAAAMSQVDIAAEAGGTAMTMTFNNIDKAVRASGDELEGWAELAGVSAQEFANAWESDPASAIEMVVSGLGDVAAQGGDVNGILDELGIKGIRQADTLRRLAQDADGLSAAFAMGNEEFEKNSALTEEAAVRYETAEAKISTAWNNIVDAAIGAGSAIAPAVGDIAEAIGDVAGWFADLPDPVLQGVAALSGVAGVASLAAGGLLLLAPRAVETWDAFRRLQKSASTLPNVIRNVGKAAGPAALALGGFAILDGISDSMSTAAASASEFENELRLLADGAKQGRDGLDELASSTEIDFTGHVNQINNLDEAAEQAAMNGFLKFIDSAENLWGLAGTPMHKQAEESFKAIDEAASSLVNGGNLEAAAIGFEEAAEALSNQGVGYEDILSLFPEYTAALQTMGAEQGVALEGMDLYEAALGNLPPALQEVTGAADEAARQDELVGALEEVGVAADGTVDSLNDYLDLLFAVGMVVMSERDAHRRYQEAIEGVGEAVEQITDPESGLGGISKALNKNKTDFDETTEAGRLAGDAFDLISERGMGSAEAMAAAGKGQDEIQEALNGTYEDLITAAGEFGITGDAAEDLALKVLGVPDGVDIKTWMDHEAQRVAEETKAALFALPEDVDIDAFMSDAAYRQAVLTKVGVDDIPDSDTVQSLMTDDAFVEAVRTRAAVLEIPEEDVVDAFMSAAARGEANDTEAAVLGIPDGVSLTSWMSTAGRNEAEGFEGVLNRIDGRHTTSSHTHTITEMTRKVMSNPRVLNPNRPGGYTGGRAGRDFGFNKLPHLANGGRLPYTGLGTDMILGVSSLGHPVAMLDDLEWTINRRSSDKYDSVLDRINQDHPSVQHLAHLRDGGRAGQLASTAMTMSPNVSVSAPPVDTAAIGSAVASAIRSYQPVVNIGGRQFAGVMQEVHQQYVARR